MSEKIRLPRPSPEPETSVESEKAFVPTAAEENVLAEMHEKTQAHRGERVPKDKEVIEKFHKDVEQCESYPLYLKYVSGEVPTLQRMFSNLEPLLAEVSSDIEKETTLAAQNGDETHLKNLQQVHKLLMGREKQVRDAIQRYVSSVIRFRQLAKNSAGGVRDMSKQFVEADHARRRAHNGLIDTLTVYVQQVRALGAMGYDSSEHFPFAYWNTSEDARTISKEKTPILSESVLKNRDFVRDWAIVADFKDQLELLGDDV